MPRMDAQNTYIPTSSSWLSPTTALAVSVLVVCLAVRLAYQESAYRSDVLYDAEAYRDGGVRAANLIRGVLGLEPLPEQNRRGMRRRCALYQIFLGVCMAARIDPLRAQAWVDTASCALFMLTIRRLAGPVPAAVGGAVYALYFPFIHATGVLLTETLAVFVLVSGTSAAVPHLSGPPRLAAALGTGLSFSLAPLVRQACLPLMLLALGCLGRLVWLTARRVPGYEWQRTGWSILAFCLAIAPPALYMAARPAALDLAVRKRVEQHPQGVWQNAVVGLLPHFDGWLPDDRSLVPADLPGLQTYVRQHPVRSIAMIARKAWRLNQYPYNTLAEDFLLAQPHLELEQRAIFFAAILGLPLVLSRWPHVAAVLGSQIIILTALVASVTVIESRYNLIIMPSLFAVATLGGATVVERVASMVRAGRFTGGSICTVGLVATAAVVASRGASVMHARGIAGVVAGHWVVNSIVTISVLVGIIWWIWDVVPRDEPVRKRGWLNWSIAGYCATIAASAAAAEKLDPLHGQASHRFQGSQRQLFHCEIRPDRSQLAAEPDEMAILFDAVCAVNRPDAVEVRLNG